MPGGGYSVARFSDADVIDAIAIRGNLEAMAARLAAEKGVRSKHLGAMQGCVDQLDVVVAGLERNPDLTQYVRLNDRFHELLLEASQSPMLQRSLQRLLVLPFAAPNAFVSLADGDMAPVRQILRVSQEQHRCIVEAIGNREGTRAEALTREHSRSAWKYLRLVFESGNAAAAPALRLIAR
jgi:GntR family transcriptional regulator of vanillate catabolism